MSGEISLESRQKKVQRRFNRRWTLPGKATIPSQAPRAGCARGALSHFVPIYWAILQVPVRLQHQRHRY